MCTVHPFELRQKATTSKCALAVTKSEEIVNSASQKFFFVKKRCEIFSLFAQESAVLYSAPFAEVPFLVVADLNNPPSKKVSCTLHSDSLQLGVVGLSALFCIRSKLGKGGGELMCICLQRICTIRTSTCHLFQMGLPMLYFSLMLCSASCTVIVLLQKSTLRHVFQPLPFGLSPVLNFFALVFYCLLFEVAVFLKITVPMYNVFLRQMLSQLGKKLRISYSTPVVSVGWGIWCPRDPSAVEPADQRLT